MLFWLALPSISTLPSHTCSLTDLLPLVRFAFTDLLSLTSDIYKTQIKYRNIGSEQHHLPTSSCLGTWQLNQPFITCGNRETIWFTTRYPYRPQHSSTTSTESWETSSQQGDIESVFTPSWFYGWDKGNLVGLKCGSSCFLFLFCQDGSGLSYCSCKNF